MTFARLAALAALGLVMSTLAASGQAAERAGVFTFTVTRDGEPIGTHRVAFRHDGARTEIDAETELEVSFAMVPLYHFKHQRREVWQDGRPLLIDAETDNNGDKLDITLQPDGAGYLRTVNDRVDKLDGSTKVLAMWNQATVEAKPGRFVSVIEDQTLELAFSLVGQGTMTLDGREITVDHYRMSGQEERDIWYDGAGQVVRVKFERGGAAIEYLRNEYRPRPFDGRFAKN